MHAIGDNEQKIFISGPSGRLEARIFGISEFTVINKETAKPNRVGIMCHPHPLYQGSMDNKVVTTVTRTWQHLGLATVRFNFRGVGESEGIYDKGIGEVGDLEAVLGFVQQKLPQAKIWLAGFSFGAFIALQGATGDRVLAGLISVAPALPFFDFSKLKMPQCPWLVIQGEKDELIPKEEIKRWYHLLDEQKKADLYWELALLPEASHFFHGHLGELKSKIEEFMKHF